MTGIIATFAVASEGYQAITELRRMPEDAGLAVRAATLVRRTAEGVELLDAIGGVEAQLAEEATSLAPGTVAMLALVDQAREGAFEAALGHLDVTVRHIDVGTSERDARRRARHEERVKKLAGALSSLRAKGEAAQAALDDFADRADGRKAAADEDLQAKVAQFAERMEARLGRAHDTLVADLDTIARSVDERAADAPEEAPAEAGENASARPATNVGGPISAPGTLDVEEVR